MNNLLFYEIDTEYINYLSSFSEHLFHNAKVTQTYSRKYIGILFEVNEIKYFAPLSSFKPKHKRYIRRAKKDAGAFKRGQPASKKGQLKLC